MGEVKLFLYVENTSFPLIPSNLVQKLAGHWPGAQETASWSGMWAMWLQARPWPLLGHSFVICKMQLLDQPICRGLSPQV